MGEIGIPRREYLYELKFSDILMIQRGYERRHRHLWSACRWAVFNNIAAYVGGKAMKEAGINSPKDLLKFPWEKNEAYSPLTDEERMELQHEIDMMNGSLPPQ